MLYICRKIYIYQFYTSNTEVIVGVDSPTPKKTAKKRAHTLTRVQTLFCLERLAADVAHVCGVVKVPREELAKEALNLLDNLREGEPRRAPKE